MNLKARQHRFDLVSPLKICIERIIDLPRCFDVVAEFETPEGLDFEFLNPIIGYDVVTETQTEHQVVTYYFATLKASVLAARMRWPGVPIEIDRAYRRRDRQPIHVFSPASR